MGKGDQINWIIPPSATPEKPAVQKSNSGNQSADQGINWIITPEQSKQIPTTGPKPVLQQMIYANEAPKGDSRVALIEVDDDLRDDEKKWLIDNRDRLSPEELSRSQAVMSGRLQSRADELGQNIKSYYFDSRGLPQPILPGQRAPVNFQAESLWGNRETAQDDSPVTTLAKQIWNGFSTIVKVPASIYDAIGGMITGNDESSQWYKSSQTLAEKIRFHTSDAAQAPIVDSKAFTSMAEFFNSDNWSPTTDNVLGLAGQAVGSVLQFLVGGRAFGVTSTGFKALAAEQGVAKAVPMFLAKNAGAIGLGTSIVLSDSMEQAEQAGVKGREKYAVALMNALGQGVLEIAIGGGERMLLGRGGAAVQREISEAAVRAFRDAGGEITENSLNAAFRATMRTTASRIPQMVREVGKVSLGEGAEEITQQMWANTIYKIHDQVSENGKFDKNVFDAEALKEYFIAGLGGVMGGVFMGGVGGLTGKLDAQSKDIYAHVKSGNDFVLRKRLETLLADGKITQEQYDLANFRIDSYQRYDQELQGVEIDDVSREQVFNLTWQDENTKKQIEQLEADDTITPTIKEAQIKNLREKSKGFVNQIAEIISEKGQREQAEQQVEQEQQLQEESFQAAQQAVEPLQEEIPENIQNYNTQLRENGSVTPTNNINYFPDRGYTGIDETLYNEFVQNGVLPADEAFSYGISDPYSQPSQYVVESVIDDTWVGGEDMMLAENVRFRSKKNGVSVNDPVRIYKRNEDGSYSIVFDNITPQNVSEEMAAVEASQQDANMQQLAQISNEQDLDAFVDEVENITPDLVTAISRRREEIQQGRAAAPVAPANENAKMRRARLVNQYLNSPQGKGGVHHKETTVQLLAGAESVQGTSKKAREQLRPGDVLDITRTLPERGKKLQYKGRSRSEGYDYSLTVSSNGVDIGTVKYQTPDAKLINRLLDQGKTVRLVVTSNIGYKSTSTKNVVNKIEYQIVSQGQPQQQTAVSESKKKSASEEKFRRDWVGAMQRVNREDPKSFEEAVLRFFLNGGTVSREAFIRNTGFGSTRAKTGKKSGNKELQDYKQFWSAKGGVQTDKLDEVEELLVERFNLDQQEAENALFDTLLSYRNKTAMLARVIELQAQDDFYGELSPYLPQDINDQTTESINQFTDSVDYSAIDADVFSTDETLDQYAAENFGQFIEEQAAAIAGSFTETFNQPEGISEVEGLWTFEEAQTDENIVEDTFFRNPPEQDLRNVLEQEDAEDIASREEVEAFLSEIPSDANVIDFVDQAQTTDQLDALLDLAAERKQISKDFANAVIKRQQDLIRMRFKQGEPRTEIAPEAAQELSRYGFMRGKTSAANTVDQILQNPATDEIRDMAAWVSSVIGNFDVNIRRVSLPAQFAGISGYYQNGLVSINTASTAFGSAADVQATILHEIMHGITDNNITAVIGNSDGRGDYDISPDASERDVKFIKDIIALRDRAEQIVSNALGTEAMRTDTVYGLYDVREFVSEMMSNPDFRAILERAQQNQPKSIVREFFEKVLNYLRGFIGIKSVENQDIVAQSIETITQYVQDMQQATVAPGSRASFKRNAADQVDPANPEQLQAVVELQNIGEQFDFDPEAHTYTHRDGNVEYASVTTVLGNDTDYAFRGRRGDGTAAERGTKLHAVAEAIASGTDAIAVAENAGLDITDEALNSLTRQLNDFMNQVRADGVLMPETIFANSQYRVAGTSDLPVVHRDGVVDIYDFKTSVRPTNVESYGKAYGGKKSKKDQHGVQLAMYANLIENADPVIGTSGMTIGRMAIVPILYKADANGRITSVKIEPLVEFEYGKYRGEAQRVIGNYVSEMESFDRYQLEQNEAVTDEEFQEQQGVDLKGLRSELADLRRKPLTAARKKREAELIKAIRTAEDATVSYQRDFKKIKDMLLGRDIESLSRDELVELKNKIMQYDNLQHNVYVRRIDFEIGRRLKEMQEAELGLTEQAEPDISKLDVLYMAPSDVQQKNPALQRVTREYLDQRIAQDIRVQEINADADRLALAVIREKVRSEPGMEKIKQSMRKGDSMSKYFSNLFVDKDAARPQLKNPDNPAHAKTLSNAELAFLRHVTENMNRYKQTQQDSERGWWDGFFPQVNSTFWETYHNSGLLAARMQKQQEGEPEDLDAMEISFYNPITRKNETSSYANAKKVLQDAVKRKVINQVSAATRLKIMQTKAYKEFDKLGGVRSEGESARYSISSTGQMIGRFQKEQKPGQQITYDVLKAYKSYMADMTHIEYMQPVLPQVTAVRSFYAQRKVNPNIEEYLKFLHEGDIMGKQFVGRFGRNVDDFFRFMQTWTYLSVMTFNLKAGVMNVAIGKFNQFRSDGGKPMRQGEARYFGKLKKARAILKHYNVVSVNVDDAIKPNASNFFMKMAGGVVTTTEHYIQGAAFLGNMTEQEWAAELANVDEQGNIIDKSKRLSAVRIATIKKAVRDVQGKYAFEDKRMYKHYAVMAAGMGFKGWMPDFLKERFGQEYTDMYGKVHKGSYRSMPYILRDIKAMVMDRKNFQKSTDINVQNNKKNIREFFVMGAMLALYAMTAGSDDREAKRKAHIVTRLLGDVGGVFNLNTWEFLVSQPMPALGTLNGAINAIGGLFDHYARDNKYGEKGDWAFPGKVIEVLPFKNPLKNTLSMVEDMGEED
jgi:hypothetical protein